MRFIENRQTYSGFRQFNLGHLLTILTVAGSALSVYISGQVNAKHTDDRLDNVEISIKSEHDDEQRMGQEIAALQLSEASSSQDRLDLHHTIEDDFSRRLGKLEDKVSK